MDLNIFIFIAVNIQIVITFSNNTGEEKSGHCNNSARTCQKYAKKLSSEFFKANKLVDNSQTLCRFFDATTSCLTKAKTTCRDIYWPPDWDIIRSHFLCYCHTKKKVCKIAYQCVTESLNNFWTQLCSDLNKFNKKQNTRPSCYWKMDLQYCKLLSVKSSCESPIFNVASSLLDIHVEHLTTGDCSNLPPHSLRRYKTPQSQCSPDLVDSMEICITTHLSVKNIVSFNEDNDLVAMGGNKFLQIACGAIKRLKSCFDLLEKNCSSEMQQIIDYRIELKKYLLKMNFICNENNLPIYKSSQTCMQTIMADAKLVKCDDIWSELSTYLSSSTAYQFYCLPNHNNTIKIKNYLTNINNCHETIVNQSCGISASLLMKELISIAFNDPSYLRFVFKPDCMNLIPLSSPTTSFLLTNTTPQHFLYTPSSIGTSIGQNSRSISSFGSSRRFNSVTFSTISSFILSEKNSSFSHNMSGDAGHVNSVPIKKVKVDDLNLINPDNNSDTEAKREFVSIKSRAVSILVNYMLNVRLLLLVCFYQIIVFC